MKLSSAELLKTALEVRTEAVTLCHKAGDGRVPSALSQVEILLALYMTGAARLDPRNPTWEDRDRIILSKGHAAITLYSVLARAGFFSRDLLDDYCVEGSAVTPFSEVGLPGVELSTGSLGHGAPISVGMAHSAKLACRDYRVFCILGDGEMAEGSVWESAIIASSLGLDNLVWIIDRNGQGAMGFTDPEDRVALDPPALEPLQKKLEAFGFHATTVDGHSVPALSGALLQRPKTPYAIIASTLKGRGYSQMENQRGWHYRLPDPAELTKSTQ